MHFFVFLSVYPGYIPIVLMDFACKKTFTRLTRVSTPPRAKPGAALKGVHKKMRPLKFLYGLNPECKDIGG